MDAFLQQFQHLKIQLEEITSATDNFNERNCIGVGGFGKVYKGEVSHSKGRSMAAIKRLDHRHGQGTPEFLKEITTLSRYSHENLITLLGFCYEGDEMILVYEHASHGSLDHHLNSPHLTWTQRLNICLNTAKGLSYLHDPRETHQRLIHCDVKSANILLDDQWNAKVSDFGLSIMGPANEQHSVIVISTAGTPGYCDPQYAMTQTLTKESDVYSFGVVLFEVLCGKLCCNYSINGRVEKNLVPTWIESYKQKKLDDIFRSPTIHPLDQSSLETFSNIAYQCLKESREERPKMVEVVTELEIALESQEYSEWTPPFECEEIIKAAEPPLNYSSNGELRKLLCKGVLLNGGKTWLSLNKKGEYCEMISFAECLYSAPPGEYLGWMRPARRSRFSMGTNPYKDWKWKTSVVSQFLSPQITYAVNLVFKFNIPARNCQLIPLKYKLQGEKITSISYLAYKREDGWWACELYQFTSDHRVVDLQIIFERYNNDYDFIEVEGIEFRPLEKVEHRDDKQPISDSDAIWEENLPTDFEDIMKLSKYSMQCATKKEACSIIRKGFLMNDDIKWFFLDKNGKKCHMVSMAHTWSEQKDVMPLPESRFGKAILLRFSRFTINCDIKYHLVSSETTYGAYLVYKLLENQSRFEGPLEVTERMGLYFYGYIYLVSPQTPVIRTNADQITHNPIGWAEMKDLPQERNDGWMEVKIWKFRTRTPTKNISTSLQLTPCGGMTYKGLVIQGIEFRPV